MFFIFKWKMVCTCSRALIERLLKGEYKTLPSEKGEQDSRNCDSLVESVQWYFSKATLVEILLIAKRKTQNALSLVCPKWSIQASVAGVSNLPDFTWPKPIVIVS